MYMQERRKTTCPLEEEHNTVIRVIFGDKTIGDKGMKDKVDEMHDILTSAKNLIKFLDRFGALLKWIAGIGLVIAIIKGWVGLALLSLIGK